MPSKNSSKASRQRSLPPGSRRSKLSSQRLARLTKRLFGLTPSQFITKSRIAAASRMLRDPDQSVARDRTRLRLLRPQRLHSCLPVRHGHDALRVPLTTLSHGYQLHIMQQLTRTNTPSGRLVREPGTSQRSNRRPIPASRLCRTRGTIGSVFGTMTGSVSASKKLGDWLSHVPKVDGPMGRGEQRL